MNRLGRYVPMIAMLLFLFTFTVNAQTGWGFQQYFISAGSNTTGYPIVTATVPVGSYVNVWGSTYIDNGNGTVSRVAILTYITPLSPNPQPQETHLLVAGVCSGFRAPTGYRKIGTYRNIYGLDNPDTGTFDQTTEFCIFELQGK